MTRPNDITTESIPRFDRRFFDSDDSVSIVGCGPIGGKATGLALADRVLRDTYDTGSFEGMTISVPRFVVIGTDVFDAFMKRNGLSEIALDREAEDDRIANAFQRAEFPAEFAGDLRAIVNAVRTPLAVRSSSLLEDAMYEPFAGVYGTKMIPNNQPDADARFHKLVDAIKFVYASTYFKVARGYFGMTKRDISKEKMAVIIQEVVGRRHDERFYPNISGVARSYNFYSAGHARPEDGVVDLALGLGKSIVDGDRCWTYCPRFPGSDPPVTLHEQLKNSQTKFWAVNMGKAPAFDPMVETEYMVQAGLAEAELDNTLAEVASTYQPENDRLVQGVGRPGARLLNFAPTIRGRLLPINDLVRDLLEAFEKALGTPVEIEFAVTIDHLKRTTPRFGFLQVRPMVVSDQKVTVEDEDYRDKRTIVASDRVLGNGIIDTVTEIVYVKPEAFEREKTAVIAADVFKINRNAARDDAQYALIGFGRWGSSDRWLGIPVDWGHITRAKVIVEATLPEMFVDLSQGSHFFHNICGMQIPYFCVRHDSDLSINWDALSDLEVIEETTYVRRIRVKGRLRVKVDGRTGRGVIQHECQA